ncbi:MAG TPA: hypothetical protein VFQ60_00835 [Patescibacteria group bacterium]|nr:hypothetical protein [Patescibacteria group bacterium]
MERTLSLIAPIVAICLAGCSRDALPGTDMHVEEPAAGVCTPSLKVHLDSWANGAVKPGSTGIELISGTFSASPCLDGWVSWVKFSLFNSSGSYATSDFCASEVCPYKDAYFVNVRFRNAQTHATLMGPAYFKPVTSNQVSASFSDAFEIKQGETIPFTLTVDVAPSAKAIIGKKYVAVFDGAGLENPPLNWFLDVVGGQDSSGNALEIVP